MTAGTERVGVLIVRIWFEDDGGSLRARITHSRDVVAAEPSSQVTASIDDVLLVVREWLERFVAGCD